MAFVRMDGLSGANPFILLRATLTGEQDSQTFLFPMERPSCACDRRHYESWEPWERFYLFLCFNFQR